MGESEAMVEQVTRTIPSKGTRLKIAVTVELFISLLFILAVIGVIDPETSGVTAAWWSEFTKWNLGIYAGSESIAKGAEGYMNRGS